MSYHTTTRRRFVRAVGAGGVAVAATGVAAASGHNRNFRAHLAGENEVPPVETDGQGQTVFQLDRGGDELSYQLIVANIEDVTQAHIHRGPPDANGPVVTFLFGFVSGGVTTNGVLAEGAITGDDLIGPLAGASLDDLLGEIRSGNTYVNVHTTANPAGEIRGQIR